MHKLCTKKLSFQKIGSSFAKKYNSADCCRVGQHHGPWGKREKGGGVARHWRQGSDCQWQQGRQASEEMTLVAPLAAKGISPHLSTMEMEQEKVN